MSVYVHPIHSRDQREQYVKFGIDLYRGNGCYVPPLVRDDMATLDPDVNPAFDFCEAQSFMAFRNGEPAGTITAIINRAANEKTGRRDLRFGFLEFIDDAEVVDALFAAAGQWGRDRGMTRMVGPMGFSDMDHEGMLIEGFDQLGTMATIYNFPYYPEHMARMGFEKEVDWVEYRIKVPAQIPDKYQRISDIVAKKYGLHIVELKNRSKVKKEYGQAIFDLINAAYADLYGYSPLTPRQIDYYIEEYIGMLNLDQVALVADSEGKLVAVGISMPNMSRALQKSRGRLWPTGWYHLLKALRGNTDTVDLLLVAVAPEYQSKGVNALLFSHLIPVFNRRGYTEAESNLELEGNESVQKQWEYFERRQHRRRRAYFKTID